ncbi:hypothetical protein IHQ68_19570, partial [Chelatococcus sambhunathii]|nr:hypothetical protein [Chelatococcus sambhunathii]
MKTAGHVKTAGHASVLIACGLKREARILSGAGVIAVAGGGDAEPLEAELERRAGAARLILSSGLCGALDPMLKVGDLVIGDLVIGGLAQPIEPLARSLPLQRGGQGGDRSGSSSILDDTH